MNKQLIGMHTVVEFPSTVVIKAGNIGVKIELTFDPATLVLITKLHVQANQSHDESTDDIDELIAIAEAFHLVHRMTDWEEYETDWLDTVLEFYNRWASTKNWKLNLPESLYN